MARFLWFVLGVVLISGCATPEAKSPEESVLPKPGKGPSVSETATKTSITIDEVKKTLDLAEYPGAKIVENNKLSSEQLSPDEARFELLRTSTDAPAKVIAFYEEKLQDKVSNSEGGKQIMGRTQRGNFVKVLLNPDGKGTKFSLSVISYVK